MTVVMYLRVGNKEQLDVETDMKKKEQEFETFVKGRSMEWLGDISHSRKYRWKQIAKTLSKKL